MKIYDTTPTNVLKHSLTEYNLNAVYTNQRIIGLPSKTELYDGNNQLQAKVTYNYDEFDFNGAGLEQIIDPIQQDRTNYPSSYWFGRGNLTSMTRHDVINASIVTSQTKYNMAGAAVAQIDPLGRTVKNQLCGFVQRRRQREKDFRLSDETDRSRQCGRD